MIIFDDVQRTKSFERDKKDLISSIPAISIIAIKGK
jgi:hypothetical protein